MRTSNVSQGQVVRIGLSLLLLVTAGILLASHFSRQQGPNELAYFYDLSEEKLFTAPLSEVPPIAGINDDQLDGLRAVVIAPGGDASVKKDRRIAYLEQYSPQFKQQVEAMRQGQTAPVEAGLISRSEGRAHTFVRRLTDDQWYPLTSAEAEKILTEWHVKGPNGEYPAVCVP